MFKNIGGKIKTLAKVLCGIGIIVFVIAGMIMIAAGTYGDDVLLPIGFLTLVFGSLFSWVSSFVLYGFGELIEKATQIERNTRDEEARQIDKRQRQNAKAQQLEQLHRAGLITDEEYAKNMN